MVAASNGENSKIVPTSEKDTWGQFPLSTRTGKAAKYEGPGVDEGDISLLSCCWAWYGGIAFSRVEVNSETTFIDRLSQLRKYPFASRTSSRLFPSMDAADQCEGFIDVGGVPLSEAGADGALPAGGAGVAPPLADAGLRGPGLQVEPDAAVVNTRAAPDDLAAAIQQLPAGQQHVMDRMSAMENNQGPQNAPLQPPTQQVCQPGGGALVGEHL